MFAMVCKEHVIWLSDLIQSLYIYNYYIENQPTLC
jgi:hypothetical protein